MNGDGESVNDSPINEALGNTPGDFPRVEAARLCQAALRPSLFLIVVGDDIREYSTRFPDSVPTVENSDIISAVADIEAYYYGAIGQRQMREMVASFLNCLLPNGGVICVPPEDASLCVVCRVGVATHVTVESEPRRVCESCAMAVQQSTGVAAKAITEKGETA